MAISFKMIPKKNTLVHPPVMKYYPCAITQGETNLDSLSEIMASRSTLSKPDIYATLIGLTEVMGEELSAGRIVRLGSMGSFQVTLQGLPADQPNIKGKSFIKKARIIYKPAKELKRMLQNLSFTKID